MKNSKYLIKFNITITIIILSIYFLPFILLGDSAYFTIHDNLDGEYVYKHLLVMTGQIFNFSTEAIIPNVMNGIPRSAYPSGLNVTTVLFYFFESHIAYIVNHIIVHLVAFWGMFLLLKKHINCDDLSVSLNLIISLCFSLIPFYTQFGLSVAGQPLLLYAYLNIMNNNQRLWDFLIIIMFPFYSNLILVALFIITFLILLLVVDTLNKQTLNIKFLLAIILLGLVYLLVEFQMIYSLFIHESYTSHRAAWDRWKDFDIPSNLHKSIQIFISTQYHTGSFPTFVIIISALLASVILVKRKILNEHFVSLVPSIAVICLIYGFHDWIVYYLKDAIPVLRYFNASRFYFLLPMLWMLLFAVSLKEIRKVKMLVPLIPLLLISQLVVLFYSNIEYMNNVKLLMGKKIDYPTYSEFFATKLFSDIDRYINRPKSSYRIASIGIHPSIAQFNGYYTLDGYQVSYVLSYKEKFRGIIERELDKNDALRLYFDEWGNRCYIFVSELGKSYTFSKNELIEIKELDLNTPILKELGCMYILSSVRILNYKKKQSGICKNIH